MKNSINTRKFIFPIAILAGAGLLYCFSNEKSSPYQNLAVKNLEIEKYVGQWYEIARFDFKHEKDMKNVTANYSKRDDGKIQVINKGYNFVKNEWDEAKGKAKFVKDPSIGAFKVSFFGPFYAEYNVVMIEEDYSSALIFGESTKYMWILSRTKTISESVKTKYVNYAKENGFPVENLVWTVQDENY
jgi:apolipoprotein D and lipocalin family protein